MTTETEQALAVLFRRFKGQAVPRDDLVKAMSLELDWTKPSLAENLLDRGLNAAHLREDEEGSLEPAFDPVEVDVPFGFAPSQELFEPVETREAGNDAEAEETDVAAGASSTLDHVLDRLAQALDGDRNEAVAAANGQQEALGGRVTLETAALLVAYKKGLDVGGEAEQVLASLRDHEP